MYTIIVCIPVETCVYICVTYDVIFVSRQQPLWSPNYIFSCFINGFQCYLVISLVKAIVKEPGALLYLFLSYIIALKSPKKDLVLILFEVYY